MTAPHPDAPAQPEDHEPQPEEQGGGPAGEVLSAVAPEPEPETDPEPDPVPLRRRLEAVLLVVDAPTSSLDLALALGEPVGAVDGELVSLGEEYTAQGRGFELRDAGGGWRLSTRAECAPAVERFVRDGQQARLTQAALETLAVVAYRQPVTRAQIAAIRGVSVDGVLRTLLSRGMVTEAQPDADGIALLYRTTPLFLERLGLRAIGDLPPIAPMLPDAAEGEDLMESGALRRRTTGPRPGAVDLGQADSGQADPDPTAPGPAA